MAKTLTISVPEKDYDFFRHAWEELAQEVITDREAGQRGAKRSAMFLMVCTAGIANFSETVRLLKEIKSLTDHTRQQPNKHFQPTPTAAANETTAGVRKSVSIEPPQAGG